MSLIKSYLKNITINQFLNSKEEKVDDNLEVIVNEIAKAYSIESRTYETDKKDIIIFRVEYFEIIKSLQKLWLYKEQQNKKDSKLISQIN